MARLVAFLFTLSLLASLAGADPATPKLPPPDAAAQKAAESLVDDAFKDDIAKAKTPQQQMELARKMLQSGIETKDDPAGRFVQFVKAENLAVQVGDIGTALSAIDEMDKTYQINALKMKADAVAAAARGIRSKDGLGSLIEQVNTVMDAAIAADRYDIAKQVAEVALATARRGSDLALVRQAAVRSNAVEAYAAAYAKLKPSLAALASSPTDPEANLAVGKFRCLVKGDWDGGLSRLALGSDGTLKALAAKELAGTTDAETQVALGDGWWLQAEKETGAARSQMQKHAASWYNLAVPTLTGLAKAKVEARLKSLVVVEPVGGIAGSAAGIAPPATYFLANLPEQEVRVGGGSFAKNGTGDALAKIGGNSSPHAIFMHPPSDGSSHVAYFIPSRRFTIFRATAGLEDKIGRLRADNGFAPLIFRVVGDGKELWRSKPINLGGETDSCEVDIIGVRKLELFIDCKGKDWFSHALWVDPVLTNPDLRPKISATDEPAAPGIKVVNLLKLADVARDSVRGNWELKNDTLSSDATQNARFEFLYQPPAEYDYRMVFVRKAGEESVSETCWAGGHQFSFYMGGSTNTVVGFGEINGKILNETDRQSPAWLQNGQRYTCVVMVRTNGVKAFLNDKLVTEWKTDYTDMSQTSNDTLRRNNTIGIGSYESPTVFYSAEITEITGKGKDLREGAGK